MMSLLPRANRRRWRLWLMIFIPVACLVVAALAGLGALIELSARAQAERLVDQRAETVLAGIADRLADRERAKRAYVQLIADTEGLAAALAASDPVDAARVLAPLQLKLSLRHLVVHDAVGAEVLALGPPVRGVPLDPLARDGRAGMTRTSTVVGDDGLVVLAVSPVKGPPGIVGTLIVANTLDGAALGGIRDRDGVELALLRDARVVTTTITRPEVLEALITAEQEAHQEEDPSGTTTHVLQGMNYRMASSPLLGGGHLEALIPIDDLAAASAHRVNTLALGAGGLVLVLLASGLSLAWLMARPLRALLAGIAQIAQGRFTVRIRPSRVAEFDDLGRMVNQLAQRLEDQVARLNHQAFYDRLTGLPNRALFGDRLGQALARANRRKDVLAVMFVDLDNFKFINDSLGHQAGDQLLIAVAERLQRCVRAEDTVARMGGDEFTVLLEKVGGQHEALQAADRIVERLAQPIRVAGQETFVTASVGIALSRAGEETQGDLLRDADAAMYRAKARGKAGHALFDQSMGTDARDRLTLEGDLRRALERGELRVHYQPIVALESGAIREVEALVRWEHPTRGLVPPAKFIPLAEETGLIVPIGLWVLGEACRQARLWHEQAPLEPPLIVSVNLSLRQFQHPGLVDDIIRTMRETDFDPRYLKLEITESAMMHDTDTTVAILWKLKELGIQLAIDDFGTGYSSLAYLKCLPIDILKIDRSFVDGLGRDGEAMAIVRAIIGLAKSLNLQVVGEGIETSEQAEHLLGLTCDRGQGYYFARPAPGDQVSRLLAGERLPARQAQPSEATVAADAA